MRSICNIDFKNNVAWGSSASAQSINEILLSIYPTENMKSNLRIEITDTKGKVITESVERERNGLINHTLSSLYYLTAGTFKLRLLSDEENSSYVLYKTLENLTDGDDIVCKYRFATQTFEVYKIVIESSAGSDYDDKPLWDAVEEIRVKYLTVDAFNAEKATIYNLIAEKANITDLTAINAEIENLKANKADIGELNAEIAKVNELIAKKANVDDLHAIEATIEQLNVHIANIDKAIIDVAHISDLEAINAKIESIEAGNINTEALEAHFARIDLANIKDGCITTAMIGEGVIESAQIADGSITDAKIVTLTANKLTAGRIDASDIEVVNLNCANLTVGTINGHQITNGAIDWDKLASQVGDTINNADENASQALDDALKAYQEAQKANSAAGTAQSTANGKNTVIYASAQPSTSGRKTNDVWFDTDDSYKMYYFNGTAWVAAQFGTNAIKNASITTALIADAAINNAKIANLDAGKITSGYISSDRIQAGSIVIGKLDDATKKTITDANSNASKALSDAAAASSKAGNAQSTANSALSKANNAQSTIDNMEVGGRNLLLKTKEYIPASNTNLSGSMASNGQFEIAKDKFQDFTVRFLNSVPQPVNGSGKAVSEHRIKNFNYKEIYTFSFWAKGTLNALCCFFYGAKTGYVKARVLATSTGYSNATFGNGRAPLKIATNSWKKYWVTWELGSSGDLSIDKLALIRTDTGTNQGSLMVCGVKLEKGNKATDWTPAPEDVDQKISDTDARITEVDRYIANWCYNNDKTYINGGKIYTGTVNASQIAANAIIAGKIAANAVTTANLQADCVNADKIAAKAINAEHINGAIITSDKIVAGAITGDKIAARTIDATKIVANTITAAEIKAGTITGDKIAAGTIDASKIKAGTITATQIAANAITSEKITADAITSAKIKTDAIKSRNYVAGSVGSFLNLADGTFTSKNLKWTADGSITASNVNLTGAITATGGKIAGWSIGNSTISKQSGDFYVVLSSSLTSNGNVLVVRKGTSSYTYPFCVRNDGTLYASNATITGKISGSSISGGTISGASITGGSITSGTSINVTTDLKVGNNIYLNQGINSIKQIVFASGNMIMNTWTNSYNYLSVRSDYRCALVSGNAQIAAVGNTGEVEINVNGNGTWIGDKYSAGGWLGFYNWAHGTRKGWFGHDGGTSFNWWNESNGTNGVFLDATANGNWTHGRFCPSFGGMALGSSNNRWYRLYASNGSDTSSDIRLKTNIKKYDERYERMYMELKPVTYELKENLGQTQCGLIAQWVYDAMINNGIEENEFGAYNHRLEDDSYGLVYEQFTSLNMHMIQKTIKRVDTHDDEIARLKERVTELQSKLNAYILGEMEIRT